MIFLEKKTSTSTATQRRWYDNDEKHELH